MTLKNNKINKVALDGFATYTCVDINQFLYAVEVRRSLFPHISPICSGPDSLTHCKLRQQTPIHKTQPSGRKDPSETRSPTWQYKCITTKCSANVENMTKYRNVLQSKQPNTEMLCTLQKCTEVDYTSKVLENDYYSFLYYVYII